MATTTYSYPNTGFTFGQRDGLAPGNAEKVIKGSQFDPEFQALQTVVNKKMDFDTQPGEFIGILDGGVIDGGTY